MILRFLHQPSEGDGHRDQPTRSGAQAFHPPLCMWLVTWRPRPLMETALMVCVHNRMERVGKSDMALTILGCRRRSSLHTASADAYTTGFA